MRELCRLAAVTEFQAIEAKDRLGSPLMRLVAAILIATIVAVQGTAARGESALELLSGFDQNSVVETASWLAKPTDREAISNAARLIYQVRRIGDQALKARATPTPPGSAWVPGDVIELRGEATEIAAARLPETLSEVLEIDRIFRFTLAVDFDQPEGEAPEDSPPSCFVMTATLPFAWLQPQAKGQPHNVRLVGVIASLDERGRPALVAAAHIEWYPSETEHVPEAGWRLLASERFDVGAFNQIRENDKKPLSAEEPFYEMLAAAKAAATSAVPPTRTQVIDLLRDSPQPIGRWLRMRVESARFTKILLDESSAAARLLGQTYYWQIDTFGKIDGRVKIEANPDSDAAGGQPIEFADRYPVSLVAATLPTEIESLIEQQAGRDAVVAMLRKPLTVDGFFFRRWSYNSEFVQSRGGGLQFGPLVVASNLQLRDSQAVADPIDWQLVVAVFFLGGLAIIAMASWWIGKRDRRRVLQRRDREQSIDFPQST